MNTIPKSQLESEYDSFASHLQSSMRSLRGSLVDLLESMGDDPRLPQEISRTYDINKNLSWKICKIINSTDPFEGVLQVPGAAGLRIACDAYRSAGASAAKIEAVETAFGLFNEMIRVHVGDRATLELYVGSRRPDGVHSEQLEDKRRLAYQGNSAIWGVQARLGMSLRLIAPNAEDPTRADIANLAGLFGFRRLRGTASWRVMQEQLLGEAVKHDPNVIVPVDLGYGGTGPPLVREFCSDPLPETRTVIENEMRIHELCEGPVGMTAAQDVTFGSVSRKIVPIQGDSPDSVGEHFCRVDTPMEAAQFDLLVHRGLPFEMPPKFVTYSRLHGDLHFPLSQNPRYHLPGLVDVQDLGSAHTGIQSVHIQNYPKLVALSCAALGHEVDAFRAYRVTVTFPPMPTILVLSHPLGRNSG